MEDFKIREITKLAESDNFVRDALLLAEQNGGIKKLPDVIQAAKAELIRDARNRKAETLQKVRARKKRNHELIVMGAVIKNATGVQSVDELKELLRERF